MFCYLHHILPLLSVQDHDWRCQWLFISINVTNICCPLFMFSLLKCTNEQENKNSDHQLQINRLSLLLSLSFDLGRPGNPYSFLVMRRLIISSWLTDKLIKDSLQTTLSSNDHKNKLAENLAKHAPLDWITYSCRKSLWIFPRCDY